MSSKAIGYVVCGTGLALVVAGLIWAATGFYAAQAPVLILVLLLGAALAWIGQRTFQKAKEREIQERISARDTDAG